jgi:hypothetical protein
MNVMKLNSISEKSDRRATRVTDYESSDLFPL